MRHGTTTHVPVGNSVLKLEVFLVIWHLTLTAPGSGVLMRKSKFSESQIGAILKEVELGIAVADLVRDRAVSRATFL